MIERNGMNFDEDIVRADAGNRGLRKLETSMVLRGLDGPLHSLCRSHNWMSKKLIIGLVCFVFAGSETVIQSFIDAGCSFI